MSMEITEITSQDILDNLFARAKQENEDFMEKITEEANWFAKFHGMDAAMDYARMRLIDGDSINVASYNALHPDWCP